MVKLTAKNDWQNATWYFRTMEECDKFKHVFDDHCCIIYWNPVEVSESFPEMSEYHFEELDKDPKKRAEEDLCWGFNSYMPDNVSEEESSRRMQPIMDMIMHRVTQSHN